MQQNDYNDFCSTLIGCFTAVGRGEPKTAAVEVFWMKLSEFDLQLVKWALVECTDSIDHGYEYNVRLIKKTIDDQLNKNKFREDAMKRLMQQEQSAKDLTAYLESDDYKNSQAGKDECFTKIQEALNNEL